MPGGFGERGIEGMIATARIAREHQIPLLGICLGMQVMVIEFARHVLGLADAHSTEFSLTTSAPVIALMQEQMDVTDLGGTMRLGACPAMLAEGSQVADALRRDRRLRTPPPPLRVQFALRRTVRIERHALFGHFT